jgi:hypothetical protein
MLKLGISPEVWPSARRIAALILFRPAFSPPALAEAETLPLSMVEDEDVLELEALELPSQGLLPLP